MCDSRFLRLRNECNGHGNDEKGYLTAYVPLYGAAISKSLIVGPGVFRVPSTLEMKHKSLSKTHLEPTRQDKAHRNMPHQSLHGS